MNTIETSSDAQISAAEIITRFVSAVRVLRVVVLNRLPAWVGQSQPAPLIGDRLRRDIGEEPVGEAIELDPHSTGSLGAGRFLTSIKRDCFRRDL